MAPTLSHKSIGVEDNVTRRSLRRELIHIVSAEAFTIALYLLLIEECAIGGYFLAIHEMIFLPKKFKSPLIDL